EDHALLRAGLKSLLDSEPGLAVCGEASEGLEAVRECARLQPNLVLIDLSMPGCNGILAIQEIHRRWPEVRILVLSGHSESGAVREALLAGAHGFVNKEVSAGELLLGVRSVLAGEPFISTDVAGTVIDGFLRRRPAAQMAGSAPASLTSREVEVLRLVADGMTSRRIAAQLEVSIKTVETHRMNLMRKLNVHKASEVTAYAITQGLVRTPDHIRLPAAGAKAAVGAVGARVSVDDSSPGKDLPLSQSSEPTDRAAMQTAPDTAETPDPEREAARLRAGFDDLAGRISDKLRKDRALEMHLAELRRQAAAIESTRSGDVAEPQQD
ncbi:MAG: response regulator transcription factor, partial [Pseudomonadota bacterium]|nr:response regulator transcription factor [Pseudomonadota bacterium]